MTTENIPEQASDEPMRANLDLVIARLEQIAGNFTDDPRNAAEEALVCARALCIPVIPAAGAVYAVLPMNEDTIAILGRPNFTCIGIANRLREMGHDIKSRSENEQAAVIHFLLNMYQQHGAAWCDRANDFLRRETDAAISAQQGPEGRQ